MVRIQGTPYEVQDVIRQTAALDRLRPELLNIAIWMEQEPGSSGVAVIDHYTRGGLLEYTFRGDKVTGPKETRAAPFSSQAEAGNVRILAGPWVDPFLDEAETFPEGKIKDQIDASSGAFNKLTEIPRKPKVF